MRDAQPPDRIGDLAMQQLPAELRDFPPLNEHPFVQAVAGLDEVEEKVASDPSSGAALAALQDKARALKEAYGRAIEERIEKEQGALPTCESVIEAGRRTFEPVYNACFGKLSAVDSGGVDACHDKAQEGSRVCGNRDAVQRTNDPAALYAAGAAVRQRATGVIQGIVTSCKIKVEYVPTEEAPRRGLKRIARIVEKTMLRLEAPGSAERVCDVVRDMLIVQSIQGLADTLDAFIQVVPAPLSCAALRPLSPSHQPPSATVRRDRAGPHQKPHRAAERGGLARRHGQLRTQGRRIAARLRGAARAQADAHGTQGPRRTRLLRCASCSEGPGRGAGSA